MKTCRHCQVDLADDVTRCPECSEYNNEHADSTDLSEIYTAALDWCLDCCEEEEEFEYFESLDEAGLRRVVGLEFAGGWPAFVEAVQ